MAEFRVGPVLVLKPSSEAANKWFEKQEKPIQVVGIWAWLFNTNT